MWLVSGHEFSTQHSKDQVVHIDYDCTCIYIAVSDSFKLIYIHVLHSQGKYIQINIQSVTAQQPTWNAAGSVPLELR